MYVDNLMSYNNSHKYLLERNVYFGSVGPFTSILKAIKGSFNECFRVDYFFPLACWTKSNECVDIL